MNHHTKTRSQLIDEIKSLEHKLEALSAGSFCNTSAAAPDSAILEKIFNAAAEGILVTDPQGYITGTNPALCRMLGFSPEELTGLHTRDLLPDGPTEKHAAMMRSLFEQGTIQNFETELRKKNGSLIMVEFTINLIYSDGGDISCAAAIVHDITDQKLSERDLKCLNLSLEDKAAARTGELREANRRLEKEIDFRRRAEQESRETRIYLENVFRATPDIIMVSDGSGIILTVSDAVEDLTGYRPDDLQGHSSAVLMPAGDTYSEKMYEMIDLLIEQGHLRNFEFFIKKKDGTTGIFECNAVALKNDDGSIGTIISVLRSIDDRKKAEQRLVESEERLRTLFENATDGILIADSQRNFIAANKTMCTMLGYEPDELTSLSVSDIHPAGDLEHVIELFNKHISGTTVTDSDVPVRRKDGSVFYADISGGPVVIDGKTYNMGMFRDMTWRRQAEKDIRKTRDFLEHIIESSLDGIVVTNPSGHIIRCNSAFCSIQGFTKREVMGRHVADRMVGTPGTYRTTAGDTVTIDDEYIYDRSAKMADTLFVKGRLLNYETYRLRKDNILVPVENNSVLLFNEQRECIGSFSIMRDITQRHIAENRLKTMNEHLEQLVEERTAELQKEIAERTQAEQELAVKSNKLEEINTALKVLIRKRDVDQQTMEENIVTNIHNLVAPYIDKLKKGPVAPQHMTLINIIESNIRDIIAPFSQNLTSKQYGLTKTEIRIANMIKTGRRTKEIVGILNISKRTVEFHRKNIRRKLGLQNTKANLRTFLQSIS